MKPLLIPVLLALAAGAILEISSPAFAQSAPTRANRVPIRARSHISRLLWVSPDGDDSTAVAGLRSKPWKTVYDIYDTNTPSFYGAATVAQPGDWIIFERGTYYVPAIPLNFQGGRTNQGVNLLVPPGTTIIHTNFSNTNSVPLPANLDTSGTFIVPGNSSRVVVEGTVIATNAAVYDGVFGWATFVSRYVPGHLQLYGFDNWPATNVLVTGHGTFIGLSDVIYVSSILGQGGGSLTLRNLHLQSQWDCCYSTGTNQIRTEHLTVYADDKNFARASHCFLILTYGSWFDIQSSLTACGDADSSPDNVAAYISYYSTNHFYGTRLIANGSTNVAPLFTSDSFSSGWYWSYPQGTNQAQFVGFGPLANFHPNAQPR